jgi:hypothetical protein
MEIPARFWGLYRDVQKRAARGVRALGRPGGAWDEILAGPMLETRSTDGLLVLDGPSALLGGELHFHLFARLRAFERADLDRAAHEDAIFAELLTTPRGILELLSHNHSRWLDPVKRHRPFIERVGRGDGAHPACARPGGLPAARRRGGPAVELAARFERAEPAARSAAPLAA